MDNIQKIKLGHVQNSHTDKTLATNSITTFKSNIDGKNSSVINDKTGMNELSNVVPDYNVKIPMNYKFIKDIKLSDTLVAKQYKLANGQNVIVLPKDGPTVVKTYVNTGSFNEPDNLRGISHYIEHNLFNGSEDLQERVFFDEVNKMGASTNASTSFSTTDYFISSNLLEESDLENTIELHAGMIQSPKFLVDKLEKEKDIVNSEINMYMAEDESLGFTQTIKNLYNIKSSSLDLVAGTTDNITALTREDVVKYFEDNYYPANMTTVITGEVNPEDTMKLVSKYFTSTKIPQGERHFEKMTPIEKTIRQDIISPKSEGKSSIFLGFAGPQNNDSKDKLLLQAVLNLAAGLSNSRLNNAEIKYGTNVEIIPDRLGSRPQDRSVIMVETKIPDEKVEPFLKDLYKAIDSLSKNPPTEEELTAIKNLMKKGHNSSLEISGALNYQIGTAFLNNNTDLLTDFDKMVDSMTVKDLVETAKKYLDLNKAALTVVHPSNTTEEQINKNYTKLSSVSFTGNNKKAPIDINSISKYRLDNNFEVTINDVDNENITYKFILEEKDWTPKKAALTSILNEMFDSSGVNGMTLPECAKKQDLLGVGTSLNTTSLGFVQNANFPASNSKEVLKYLEDRIKNPDLNRKVFEDCVAKLRDYYSTCEVSPLDKYNAVMYKGTQAAFTTKEKLKSLDSITYEDVIKFYNDTFKNGMGQVIVTGPFSKHPELKQQIFESVSTYPKAKACDISLSKIYEPIEKTQVFTEVNKKNQARILQGYKFKQSGNIKDKVCINLLNDILGGTPSSRLFSDLREQRHLAYNVFSEVNYKGNMGILTLSIKTTTENLETGEKSFDNIKKSIDGFNENIDKMKTEKVSQEELDNAKRNLKSMLLSSLETSSDKNSMITVSNSTPYGVEYINKVLETIDNITVDDIYNTANNIFNTKPIYSITATKASFDANKEFLTSLEG